jgi:hypothetical protein
MEKPLKKEKTLCDIEKDSKNDCPDASCEDHKDLDLEVLKSTRSNFLSWKDHDY